MDYGWVLYPSLVQFFTRFLVPSNASYQIVQCRITLNEGREASRASARKGIDKTSVGKINKKTPRLRYAK